ncbi:helix-turn-helix domain-containing protein [Flavobacterium sp. LS1P3]|jgi:AraC-like DNA-binding protein|uniref:helix-turn-helix domain-containing protein n=1 Tax=Flavobacterium sp. LS1P3 TaxID=3401720 RepID=UPI003AAD1932
MNLHKNEIAEIRSIAEFHRLFGLPKPLHPLISVINFEEVDFMLSNVWKHFVNDMYSVSIKKGETGKIKYGQTVYDFDEGIMTLTAPKQVIAIEKVEAIKLTGFKLLIHPDFIYGFPLAKTIKTYGFFSYTNNKALFLSDREEKIILNLFKSIEQEYQNNIDQYSQEVIIANIELLLKHIDRYYNRQFLTRKNISNDTLSQVDNLLTDSFNNELTELPTVQYLANQLNITTTYLSDLLKNITGQTAQQHIHEKLIEKAKELLSTTNLSVSEIAYQLGFEFPQSFNKLFKNKTNVSPLEFRQSFN